MRETNPHSVKTNIKKNVMDGKCFLRIFTIIYNLDLKARCPPRGNIFKTKDSKKKTQNVTHKRTIP